MSSRRLVVLLVLMWVVGALPVAAQVPANTVSGIGVHEGERVSVNQGLAWWSAEDNQINVALFDHAPPPGMLTSLRSGSWGDGGPIMILHVGLKPGVPAALPSVTGCYVNVAFPKAGPMGYNADTTKGCGLIALDGSARPGGNVMARFKGQAPGAGEKPYSWDVAFNLPIAK